MILGETGVRQPGETKWLPTAEQESGPERNHRNHPIRRSGESCKSGFYNVLLIDFYWDRSAESNEPKGEVNTSLSFKWYFLLIH